MGMHNTIDAGLGEFIVGKRTGSVQNFSNPLIAQPHNQSALPPTYAPPQPGFGSTIPGLVIQPQLVQELTPKERADIRRRKANRAAITRKAPLLRRMTGRVVSYLDINGRPITNEKGDFANGDVVPRREHFRRLEKHYRNHWEELLEQREAIKDSSDHAARCYLDAYERLDLLTRGLFLAPVSRDAMTMVCYLYRQKRTLFGRRKIVRNKVKRVRISEFDRRLRKFIDLAFTDAAYANAKIGGYPLHSLSARQLVYGFCSAPSSLVQTD